MVLRTNGFVTHQTLQLALLAECLKLKLNQKNCRCLQQTYSFSLPAFPPTPFIHNKMMPLIQHTFFYKPRFETERNILPTSITSTIMPCCCHQLIGQQRQRSEASENTSTLEGGFSSTLQKSDQLFVRNGDSYK